MNRVRTAHGLRPLVADHGLETVARAHCAWMLRTGQMSHSGFPNRIVRSHAHGPVFGENLAWGVGSYESPTAIVNAWLASPEHRDNLLRPGFHRIGLGRYVGRFAGFDHAAVVTADFAGS
jgi:uncharacterized protein YkwD